MELRAYSCWEGKPEPDGKTCNLEINNLSGRGRWATQSSKLPQYPKVNPRFALQRSLMGKFSSTIRFHLRPLFCALKNRGHYNITAILTRKGENILEESKQREMERNPVLPSNFHPYPYPLSNTVKIKPLGRKEDVPGYLVRTLVVQLGSLIILQSGPWEQFPCLGTTALKRWSEECKSSHSTGEWRRKNIWWTVPQLQPTQTPNSNEKMHLQML